MITIPFLSLTLKRAYLISANNELQATPSKKYHGENTVTA